MCVCDCLYTGRPVHVTGLYTCVRMCMCVPNFQYVCMCARPSTCTCAQLRVCLCVQPYAHTIHTSRALAHACTSLPPPPLLTYSSLHPQVFHPYPRPRLQEQGLGAVHTAGLQCGPVDGRPCTLPVQRNPHGWVLGTALCAASVMTWLMIARSAKHMCCTYLHRFAAHTVHPHIYPFIHPAQPTVTHLSSCCLIQETRSP